MTLYDELRQQQHDIDVLEAERDRIETELDAAQDQQQELVTTALYELQDSLDEDETVPLIDAEEVSRGGHYTFQEVLTADGVVAADVTGMGKTYRGEERSSDALYGWTGGHWAEYDEPLDIAGEYLTGQRSDPDFIDTLADRLQHIDANSGTVPTYSFHYD